MELRAILVVSCFLGVNEVHSNEIEWKNCDTNPSHPAITINRLDILPNPIILEKEYSLVMDTSVNTDLESIFVTQSIAKSSKYAHGGSFHVPCLATTTFGYCKNMDFCRFLRAQSQNDSDTYDRPLGLGMLSLALGNPDQCPINQGSYFQHQMLRLPDRILRNNTIFNTEAPGEYNITMSFENDTGNLGCFWFKVVIERQSAGPAFG